MLGCVLTLGWGERGEEGCKETEWVRGRLVRTNNSHFVHTLQSRRRTFDRSHHGLVFIQQDGSHTPTTREGTLHGKGLNNTPPCHKCIKLTYSHTPPTYACRLWRCQLLVRGRGCEGDRLVGVFVRVRDREKNMREREGGRMERSVLFLSC